MPSPSPTAPFVHELADHERPRIRECASAALRLAPRTVTAVRKPRSAGDAHDFSSDGDYWWPDPARPEGPYVRRDGLSNPDAFTAHRQLLLEGASAIGTLTAAWSLDRDPGHSAAAVAHLRAWFVNPATRMRPNLRFAQAIRGVCAGRGIGIIDTVHLAEVALAVLALRGSPALDAATEAALGDWFRAYLDWLRHSDHGLDEKRQRNNHGVCWWLQAVAFAHLLGDEAFLDEARDAFPGLLADQLSPEGFFSRELARTKPYAYSLFTLDVFCALAALLSTPSRNLLAEELPAGPSLLRAIAWIAPFIAQPATWPFPRDVQHAEAWPLRHPALLFGARAGGPEEWFDLWRRLPAAASDPEAQRQFPIREPLLWMLGAK